ncbi:MAG: ABC transporter substrate-binding protein, partial [Phycisphaerales bacterium]|nr:ABC transporter substrate-binding protein [Phycisphaerales bacterium]
MPTIPITLGHSPDADDAFMWWPLGTETDPPTIDCGPFRFTCLAEDIAQLNRRALAAGPGDGLDVTAISIYAFAHAAGRYALTSCGWSMGEGYGPKLVARRGESDRVRDRLFTRESPGPLVAVPGVKTSAFLTLSLMLGHAGFAHREMRFDHVLPALADRSSGVDAALVIHEAQVTYPDEGFELVADLGAWWTDDTGLPLPLGGNAARLDLDARFGPGTLPALASVLRRSIDHARAHRDRSFRRAMQFAGTTPRPLVERFVDLYVNDLTADAGDRGRRAVELFLRRGAALGLCPDPGPIRLITPG